MALTEDNRADLKEALRRRSPETIEAAIRVRQKSGLSAIHPVVHGLIERHQPSTARLLLKDAKKTTHTWMTTDCRRPSSASC